METRNVRLHLSTFGCFSDPQPVVNERGFSGAETAFFLDSHWANVFFGILVSVNAVLVGIEVDYDDSSFGMLGM